MPFAAMAESCPGGKWEDNITSDGRNLGKCVCYVASEIYPDCSGSCTGGRVLSGGECRCPQANQYWNGSSCVITTNDDAGTRNNCDAIICIPPCDWKHTGKCSTVQKQGYYSESLKRCVCPAGYYSNEAPTEGSSGGSSGGSGSSTSSVTSGASGISWISNSYTVGNGAAKTPITMPSLSSTGSIPNPITSGSFADLIARIIDWVLNIALILAPLVVVYGGFIYMTAMGDTNKVSQGKNIILYAVIGFIVALLAKSLIGIFTGLVVK